MTSAQKQLARSKSWTMTTIFHSLFKEKATLFILIFGCRLAVRMSSITCLYTHISCWSASVHHHHRFVWNFTFTTYYCVFCKLLLYFCQYVFWFSSTCGTIMCLSWCQYVSAGGNQRDPTVKFLVETSAFRCACAHGLDRSFGACNCYGRPLCRYRYTAMNLSQPCPLLSLRIRGKAFLFVSPGQWRRNYLPVRAVH